MGSLQDREGSSEASQESEVLPLLMSTHEVTPVTSHPRGCVSVALM